MTHMNIHLLDLPDEILFTILKKLDNMNVLYSLIGIGIERLDLLAKDKTFTNTLNFVLNDVDSICTIPDPILNRFYIDILPEIQCNVRSLIFESIIMERILLAADYPNLTQLKIFKFNRDFVSHYFIDESPFGCIFKQQITDLTLISNEKDNGPSMDYTTNVYERVLNFFKNLKHLSVVRPFSGLCPSLLFRSLPSTTFCSSTLTKLLITVCTFDDCLSLLDGRLKQLSTFIVSIDNVRSHSSILHISDDLLNMKCFSLTIRHLSYVYDTQVVPLLRRMCNLEELTLYLCIYNRARYVDGIQLQNDILIHLQQLRTFVFYVSTEIHMKHSVLALSNDDIQRTFTNVKYGQVGCFVDYCITDLTIFHVFSLPFTFDRLEMIHNNLPNIIFNNVTFLMIIGSVPFKHEYFIRLAQSFPLLKSLRLANLLPQLSDSDKVKSDNDELYLAVEYPHITSLDIRHAYIDYGEQFLHESKTRLPNLVELKIHYDILETLTENFTRDATRVNCIKVKRLIVHDEYDNDIEIIVQPKDFYIYFPLL